MPPQTLKRSSEVYRPLFTESGKEIKNIFIFNYEESIELKCGFIEDVHKGDLTEVYFANLRNKRTVDFARDYSYICGDILYIYSPSIIKREYLAYRRDDEDVFRNRITFLTDDMEVVIDQYSRAVKTEFGLLLEKLDQENKRRGIDINIYELKNLLKFYDLKPKKRPDFKRFDKVAVKYQLEDLREYVDGFHATKRRMGETSYFVRVDFFPGNEFKVIITSLKQINCIKSETKILLKEKTASYSEALKMLNSKLKEIF